LTAKKPVTPDVLVANEGTVVLFNSLTARAKEWIGDNVQPDDQWFGTTLVVEHRYAWGLAEGMKDAGLVLE
jgi:hypothetical protein